MFIVLVLLIAVCGVVYAVKSKEESKTKNVKDKQDIKSNNYITYEGQKYKLNTDLTTILFLGVDKSGTAAEVKGVTGHNGQSDTIILFVMNNVDKTTTLIEVSRDSMAEIKLYNYDGKYVATETAQITLQYAYGDGGNRSCQLTKDAVSKLLNNISIRSYLALTMEGIMKITDLVGGVEIMVPEDYTYIDPAFVAGTTIKLTGEQAEKYVRYRDISVTGSNDQRMERQTQFLKAMVSQLKQMSKVQQNIYSSLMGGADDYIITDMSADEMQTLSDYEMSDDILKVPGETVEGEEHDEYLVNNAELYRLLLKVFYKSVN